MFQRTAVTDTTLGGLEIKAGQRVGLFYRSANFDEEVFDEPEQFDVLRNPNPHLGYGGLGTHYCLGASLAKLEIQLIFNAIADAMPDIAKAAIRCACAPAGSTASSAFRSATRADAGKGSELVTTTRSASASVRRPPSGGSGVGSGPGPPMPPLPGCGPDWRGTGMKQLRPRAPMMSPISGKPAHGPINSGFAPAVSSWR